MPDVWPFVPLPSITESMSFATEVQATPEAEFRRARRGARRAFSYTFGTAGELQRMEQLMFRNPTGVWDVPIWTESSKAGPVLSTDTVLNVDLDASYTDRALIWGDCDQFEVVEIAAISDVLELAAPVGQGFENPSVMPLKTGIAPGGIELNRKGYEFFDVRVRFELSEPDLAAETSLPQYLGLDYVECAGSYMAASSGTASWIFDRGDNNEGPVDLTLASDLFGRRAGATFVMETPAKRRAFSTWLNHLRGRDRPFFIPLPGGDLKLAEPALVDDASILIVPQFDTAAEYVSRHLSLSYGQMREVTAAAIEGLNVRLTLDAALTAQATLPTLIVKVRLDSDTVDLAHERHFWSRTSLTFAEVP